MKNALKRYGLLVAGVMISAIAFSACTTTSSDQRPGIESTPRATHSPGVAGDDGSIGSMSDSGGSMSGGSTANGSTGSGGSMGGGGTGSSSSGSTSGGTGTSSGSASH